MYIYVCMHVCMYECTYVHTNACVCNVYDAFMYGQISTWIDAS